MTKWPLICDECNAEVYVGGLYGGMCKECHMEATIEALNNPDEKATAQSGLGDFA